LDNTKILDFTEGREILREMLEPYVFSGSQILFHTEYLSKSYPSKILFNELKILEYDDYYYKLVNYNAKICKFYGFGAISADIGAKSRFLIK
jgi:hypothetical protein